MTQPQKVTNLDLYNLIIKLDKNLSIKIDKLKDRVESLSERFDDFEGLTMKEFNKIYQLFDNNKIETENGQTKQNTQSYTLERHEQSITELKYENSMLRAKAAEHDTEIAKLKNQ